MLRSHTLTTIATSVATVGHGRVKPSVYFNPIAQPTSNSPATITINQAIVEPLRDVHARRMRACRKAKRPDGAVWLRSHGAQKRHAYHGLRGPIGVAAASA